MAGARAQRR